MITLGLLLIIIGPIIGAIISGIGSSLHMKDQWKRQQQMEHYNNECMQKRIDYNFEQWKNEVYGGKEQQNKQQRNKK